jgi:hypothetical protein
MGSLGNPILLVLINACNLGMDCPREQYELHLFSHLLRDSVEAYSSTLPLRAFVMIKEET